MHRTPWDRAVSRRLRVSVMFWANGFSMKQGILLSRTAVPISRCDIWGVATITASAAGFEANASR
jgi:hypothetical protein